MKNTDSNKVFIVTRGEYSDYRIEAVLKTREDAELYGSTFGGDISEWEFSTHVIEGIREGRIRFEVVMFGDGTTHGCYALPYINGRTGTEVRSFRNHRHEKDGELYMRTLCEARDKVHAIKIANERRMALVAFDLWQLGAFNENLTPIEGDYERW